MILNDDTYAVLTHRGRISRSQDERLRSMPFVGEDFVAVDQPTPSPTYDHLPVSSADIVMLSAPDTQEDGNDCKAPQDIFHTPPEDSSLPLSDDQQGTCTVNRPVVNYDAGSEDFVDFSGSSDAPDSVNLGRNNELGFSEPHPNKQIDVTGAAQGDGLKRKFSDLGEPSLKKLKFLEHDLGFAFAGASSEVQLHDADDVKGKCKGKLVPDGEQVPSDAGNEEDYCKDVPKGENTGSGENVGNQAPQVENEASAENANLSLAEILALLVEGNKSSEGLKEPTGNRLTEEDLEGLSLLQVATKSGINFPRPRWWPDDMDEDLDVLKIL